MLHDFDPRFNVEYSSVNDLVFSMLSELNQTSYDTSRFALHGSLRHAVFSFNGYSEVWITMSGNSSMLRRYVVWGLST